jgi:hypothetical protein
VRNEFVVGEGKLRSAAREGPNGFERRCLYFAGAEGHAECSRRVFDRKPHRAAPWSVSFDGEVTGPWSNDATVWRGVPEMPSREYLDPTNSCFVVRPAGRALARMRRCPAVGDQSTAPPSAGARWSARGLTAASHANSSPRIVPVAEANRSVSMPMRWSIETKRLGSG